MPTLSLPDSKLHYEFAGRGRPILLIQGAGVAGSGWTPQVKALSDEFQCLSFDNRGIGDSIAGTETLTIEQMARDAAALLDAAGWESAHVAGHSMGGLIAQQLALDAPSRVRSMALLCTFSKGVEAARLTPRVLWMGLGTRVGTAAMRRHAFLKMLFPEEFVKAEGAWSLAARVEPLIGRDLAHTPPVVMRQLAAMRRHDGSARLAELARIPTLVVSAECDPIALPEYGQRLQKCIPGSRYVEIPGASHGVTIQMPDCVNELLRVHFNQAEPS